MYVELVRRFHVKCASGIDVPNAHHLAERLTAHRSGIHAQRSANFARNSFQPLKAADLRVTRRVSEFLLFYANTRDDLAVANFDLLEFTTREENDDAANPSVAHEQIRAASTDHQGNAALTRKPDEAREAFLGFRLDPELRRSSDAHGCVLGHRLPPTRHPPPAHTFTVIPRTQL